MSSDYLSINDPYHIAATAAAALHSAHALHGAHTANPPETSPMDNNPDAQAASLDQMLAQQPAASISASAPATATPKAAASAASPASAGATAQGATPPKTAAEIAKEAELLEYLNETPDSLAAHAEIEGAPFGSVPAMNNPAAGITSNTGPAASGFAPPQPAPSTIQPSEQEIKSAYLDVELMKDQALINAGVLSPGPTSIGTELRDILESEMELAAEQDAAQVTPQQPVHHINYQA